jgi:hypothetical protein
VIDATQAPASVERDVRAAIGKALGPAPDASASPAATVHPTSEPTMPLTSEPTVPSPSPDPEDGS